MGGVWGASQGRAEARSPSGMQDGSFVQAARGQANLERSLLTMEPETTIRSRKRSVMVNRGKSMRRRLLLVGEKLR
jgi:D-alanyl-D-alanine carboxypeptidase